MKITVDGNVYEFDAAKLSVREAFVVFDQTKLTMASWQAALADGNPYALASLVFLLKQRAGENPDWNTLDFDLGSIEVDAGDEEADASDPSPQPEPAEQAPAALA